MYMYIYVYIHIYIALWYSSIIIITMIIFLYDSHDHR